MKKNVYHQIIWIWKITEKTFTDNNAEFDSVTSIFSIGEWYLKQITPNLKKIVFILIIHSIKILACMNLMIKLTSIYMKINSYILVINL